jgi:hypothetical protein
LPASIKSDRIGRTRYRPQYKAEVLAAYKTSGLSGPAFARECGIKYPTFASWVAKDRKSILSAPFALYWSVRQGWVLKTLLLLGNSFSDPGVLSACRSGLEGVQSLLPSAWHFPFSPWVRQQAAIRASWIIGLPGFVRSGSDCGVPEPKWFWLVVKSLLQCRNDKGAKGQFLL